jgi:hypothetical protein
MGADSCSQVGKVRERKNVYWLIEGSRKMR